MKMIFRISTFEPKTLLWWNSKRNKINMSPTYQRRGRLWSNADKAYLIDSILNGFDLPKIYIADFTWGNSKLNISNMPYAIIDGKQRFEAIYDFFDGKISLNDDFVYVDNPNIKIGGLGYKDLLNNYRDIAEDFQNFSLHVMGVFAKEETPINELFVRLNRSKALTGAEIRNAMNGPAPVVIRGIADNDFFKSNIRFNIKRGQDLNASAKILMFEYNKSFSDTTKSSLDSFVKTVSKDKNGRLELAGRYVVDNLSDMNSIFLPKDSLLTSAGIIPVFYRFIRDIGEKNYLLVREFLYTFEKARKYNRKLLRENPMSKKIKPVFSNYDIFNRSTDNQQSHQERYKILTSMFTYYSKYKKLPVS